MQHTVVCPLMAIRGLVALQTNAKRFSLPELLVTLHRFDMTEKAPYDFCVGR
jgi:hypothetical protein